MKPTIGRIVLYVISEHEAAEINHRRTNPENIANRIADKAWPLGAQAHIGNPVNAGDILPAQIVKVWGDGPDVACNLKVNLDGTDTYWARSRCVNDDKEPGTWHWMEYQKQVAALPATNVATGIAPIPVESGLDASASLSTEPETAGNEAHEATEEKSPEADD